MLVIRAGRAFDGEREVRGGIAVVIREGQIAAVRAPGEPLPEEWPVTEFPQATLLPGLIDMHVHLGGDSRDGALDRLPDFSDDELDAVIAESLRRQLAAGVTTVRDLGDRRWSVVDRRDEVEAAGTGVAGPTIVAAGPPITSVRGHCWAMGGEAAGAGQLREAVAERVERGVDVIKVMLSGGALTPGTDAALCQFSDDEARLVVDLAHGAGLPVTVHAHGLAAVEQAMRIGVDGIEHCTCLAESGVVVSDQLLETLVRQRITVCPTLGKTVDAVPPAAVLALMERFGFAFQDRQRLAGRMHRAGVRLVSGSDAGISSGKPHGILPMAVADLVAGGVPAADALASATSIAAEACGLGHRKGRLRVGYDADLLIVDGDLLGQVETLTRVAAVMVGGRWAFNP